MLILFTASFYQTVGSGKVHVFTHCLISGDDPGGDSADLQYKEFLFSDSAALSTEREGRLAREKYFDTFGECGLGR